MYVNYNTNQALSDFNAYMDLNLSQAAFDALTQNCSNIGTTVSLIECAQIAYAQQKHVELTAQYDNYAVEFSQAGFTSVEHFIAQQGINKYFATVAVYEAMNAPDAWWELPDQETFEFYVEMFATLLPLGITFIPYGVGDIADIYQSCGGASWGCALAVVGVLVPWDEMVDIWRRSDQIKAAWKSVKNYTALKNAWKFIQNCPRDIRTNSYILEGVRQALQRGIKNVDEMVTHANVSYINQATIEHVFRGSNSGGVHHISALIADPNTYKIHNRTPTNNGCYKATIYKNGVPMTPDKDFFPDTWTENQVINAIKGAYNNATQIGNTNNWVGTSNGISIMIYKAQDGKIISAFPHNP
jgi:hypothetical protein